MVQQLSHHSGSVSDQLSGRGGDSGDAFITKLNADGSALVYSTYLGGSNEYDLAISIAVDATGNAYVTGDTWSSNFPTTPGAFQPNGWGYINTFVTKLNVAGSALVYSTYLSGSPGSDYDWGQGIAVDASGNAYVTGYTNSIHFPTTQGAFQTSLGGYGGGVYAAYYDAFVTKLNVDGSALVYSTYLGGSFWDFAYGIAVDASGNAYVSGRTASSNFPTTPGAVQTSYGGGIDAFVTKLNAAGSALVYSTYLGENENHNAIGIAVDASGNAYVTGYTSGYTNSTNFPTTPGAFQPNYGGGSFDAFVAKLSPVPAAAGLDRSSLSFGNVLVNLTSPGQSVTLTNIGDDPLNITSITAGGDFALVTTATSCAYGGSTLVPGANCTIDVTFTPTATGNRTGIVTIADNAAHGPQVVQLSGTGVVGAPSISPLTLSFSDQLVGTTSASQPVTVTNTGTVALSFTSLAISIDWTESDNCLPSVAPSASCTINVSFKPTANGSLAGALTLTDNALNSPQTVNLSGTGLGATAGLSASSLTFSSQRVGTTTSAQQVTLQNTGNQALAITSISRAGANSGDFSLGQDCGSSLAAAETCHINVTFTPTARGARTAAVSLVDNAANSPQTISLSGTGIAPVANLSPNSVTFPGQFVGTTGLPENITLTNNGDMPLTISGIQASTDFGTSNGCTSSLAAGVNCTISVFFDPSAAGTRTGTLTVTDNAPGSPQTVQLSGTGKDFAMSSTTTSASVAAGQTATYSVAVTPQGGLNETVSLTCSGAPARSTCTVSPGSVPLNGTTPTSVTVSVSTTAGSMTPPAGITLPPDASGFGRLIWLWCLLALSALAALATRRRQAGLLLGLSLMMLVFWGACGGVTSRVTSVVHTPGTPAGMYSLSVTGTVTSAGSTSTQLTHEVKLSLQVN